MMRCRRGYLLIETVVATGVLAAAVALCLQVLATARLQQRGIERRTVAMQEAANLIEAVAALPFDQITQERLDRFTLPPETQKLLPSGKLAWKLETSEATPSTKHVRAEITWATTAPEAAVRLSYWASPMEGAP